MGAFTDATDQLFKDLYKEVDDYFNAIADAALKEDKDTWGDLNNFHYAASMAWQVQGIVATIGDEMKNQEKNRTDLGLWVGPAADVYGSAMKTLITFVERINTALQPDNPNPDFGTPTQPAQIPVSAYGWSQWLNVLYLWQVQVNIAVHDNWQKAYDWIGREQTETSQIMKDKERNLNNQDANNRRNAEETLPFLKARLESLVASESELRSRESTLLADIQRENAQVEDWNRWL